MNASKSRIVFAYALYTNAQSKAKSKASLISTSFTVRGYGRGLVEASNLFDLADDVVIQLFEVFGRDPILEDRLAADLLDLIAIEE